MEKKEKVKKSVVKNDTTVLDKNEKKLIKFIALLSAFFAAGLAIMMLVFGIISTIAVAKLPKSELVDNNIVVTLLSKIDGYSVIEAKSIIGNMSNSFSFIMLEIIIPIVAFIGALVLIIFLSKKVLDFISDVNTEKDLFSKEKLNNLQEMISYLSVILLALLVIFNEPSIIVYLFIELLLIIIYGLFKYCVKKLK